MSYHSPEIPSLELSGLDSKIQDIQELMDFDWLGKAFGLADRIVEERDGSPYVYPAVFESNRKDPIPLLPSDTWKSYCFFVAGDSSFEFDAEYPPKNPIITVPVSCIFYVDIIQVDRLITYKETKSKIKEDIFNFFNKKRVNRLLQTGFIEDDITRIFEGYSIDQIDNKFRMYPKWACRMNFDLSYRDDCYVLNTY